MGIRHFLEGIGADRKSFGWGPAMRASLLRGLAALGDHRVLRCVVIEKVAPEVTKTSPNFECRFLSPEEIKRFGQSAEYEMDAEFVAGALRKGDRCFAILDGDVLASYGWYSTRPTAISNRLQLSFLPEYVYMYKGFTHPQYRGKRLHSVGMGLALNDYVAQGQKGIVSYVESHNLASLKSCYRMGYRDFGQVAYFKVGPRYVTFASAGCSAFGLRVEEIRRAAHSSVPETAGALRG